MRITEKVRISYANNESSIKRAATFILGAVVGMGVYTVLRELVEGGILNGTNMVAKDWAAFYLALFAFLLSLASFFYNHLKAQREAFLDIHEKMIAIDIQDGRGILYNDIESRADVERLKQENPEGFQKVNRAIAMYDVLAMYASRGYLPRQLILEEWGRNLAKYRQRVLLFGDVRGKNWEHYEDLSKEACDMYPEACNELPVKDAEAQPPLPFWHGWLRFKADRLQH